jgi:hypothetical protein
MTLCRVFDVCAQTSNHRIRHIEFDMSNAMISLSLPREDPVDAPVCGRVLASKDRCVSTASSKSSPYHNTASSISPRSTCQVGRIKRRGRITHCTHTLHITPLFTHTIFMRTWVLALHIVESRMLSISGHHVPPVSLKILAFPHASARDRKV